MDKLAKQQACQLFIEQEIEKGISCGKTHREIGREIARLIKKLFEAEVNPETIAKRADRISAATNVAPNTTTENQREKDGNQDSMKWGGEREGAGRPPKLGPPRNGVQFARMAIMDLEKITDEDVEREEAFQMVTDWLVKQLN